MAASLNIRRADVRDASALAMLFGDLAMLPFTSVAPYSSVAHWEKKLAEYADAACLPLVALDGDALTGILFLRAYPNHIRRKHCATIDLLAVRPDYRRKGVGRALMDGAIAACDHWLQMRRIELIVDTQSAALKHFYGSFGFAEEGIERAHIVHASRYVDGTVMSRINRHSMPAPASPPLPNPTRTRKSAPLKITVRAATETDAEAFAKVFSDRSASNGTLQHPYTSPEVWRTRLAGNVGTRQVVLVAIVNGRIVGNAGLHAVSENPRQKHVCSLGISIAHAYQGRGVGRALMNACLDFADHWANYSRVALTVHADNMRAIKLYESLGFQHEGRLRDFSFREGGYVDALFMARLTTSLTNAS
ncbi:MAG: GNAT family N-acetyltransferase [Casimicrobium sp.]